MPNWASHTQRYFILTSRIIRQQVIQYELLGFSQLMMMPVVSQRCANRNSLKDFTLAFELSLCTFTPSTIAHKISGACLSFWFYKTQQFPSLCMGKQWFKVSIVALAYTSSDILGLFKRYNENPKQRICRYQVDFMT